MPSAADENIIALRLSDQKGPTRISTSGMTARHTAAMAPASWISSPNGPRGSSARLPAQVRVQLTIPGNRDFYVAQTSFTSKQGGFMEVKAIFGQELARFWKGSLEGRTLPGWEDIRLDLKGRDLRDRAVLVCFWDLNQRPSRRCMEVLAQRVEELQHNRVTVIAIQAAKVDENALNEWAQEHGTPFVVGMLTGDSEKIRSEWAVPSLPWLILTDRQHLVRAEGFDANELAHAFAAISIP